jgi:hypothetical protein
MSISRILASLFPWRRPKVSAAYQRVLDPPPPGPPAHRLLAAVRARRGDGEQAALDDNAAAGAPVSNGVASDQNLLAKRRESTP